MKFFKGYSHFGARPVLRHLRSRFSSSGRAKPQHSKSILLEIPNPQQISGAGCHRWFTSPDMDLIIWLDASEGMVGFQLCYDKDSFEKAFTWHKSRSGYQHAGVSSGEERYGRPKETPVLVADGEPDFERIAKLFQCSAQKVPEDICGLVVATIASQ